jgi:hypothetical protein
MRSEVEITVREALQLTGYTRQQVYNLLVAKRVQSRKLGHQYFINRRSLLNYVKTTNRGPKTPTRKEN